MTIVNAFLGIWWRVWWWVMNRNRKSEKLRNVYMFCTPRPNLASRSEMTQQELAHHRELDRLRKRISRYHSLWLCFTLCNNYHSPDRNSLRNKCSANVIETKKANGVAGVYSYTGSLMWYNVAIICLRRRNRHCEKRIAFVGRNNGTAKQ